jgi:hypothetical protein
MAEMCAWQPFTHQTGTTALLLYVYLNTHIRPSLHIQVTLSLPEYKLSSHIKHSVNSSLILAQFANIFILFAASFHAQHSMYTIAHEHSSYSESSSHSKQFFFNLPGHLFGLLHFAIIIVNI